MEVRIRLERRTIYVDTAARDSEALFARTSQAEAKQTQRAPDTTQAALHRSVEGDARSTGALSYST